MSEVNLQTYLETGEVPSDPEVLAELLKQMEGAEQDEVVDDKQAVADSSAAEVTTDPGTTKTAAESDKDADGILSANGKHVLPYDVLKQERAEKAALKAELEAAQKAVEDLRNSGAVSKQSLAEFTGMTDEELAELKEYFPDRFDNFVAALNKAHEAEAKVSQYEAAEQQRQEQSRREIAMTVQEHIDNNQLLSEFQKDPAKWEVCKSIDNSLRNDPETANLTMQERFDRVAKSVAQLYGIKADDKVETQTSKGKPQAEVSKPKINSLSDLPAGSAPEASEFEKLENMSAAELGAMFAKMTPEQQANYLNNF